MKRCVFIQDEWFWLRELSGWVIYPKYVDLDGREEVREEESREHRRIQGTYLPALPIDPPGAPTPHPGVLWKTPGVPLKCRFPVTPPLPYMMEALASSWCNLAPIWYAKTSELVLLVQMVPLALWPKCPLIIGNPGSTSGKGRHVLGYVVT